MIFMCKWLKRHVAFSAVHSACRQCCCCWSHTSHVAAGTNKCSSAVWAAKAQVLPSSAQGHHCPSTDIFPWLEILTLFAGQKQKETTLESWHLCHEFVTMDHFLARCHMQKSSLFTQLARQAYDVLKRPMSSRRIGATLAALSTLLKSPKELFPMKTKQKNEDSLTFQEATNFSSTADMQDLSWCKQCLLQWPNRWSGYKEKNDNRAIWQKFCDHWAGCFLSRQSPTQQSPCWRQVALTQLAGRTWDFHFLLAGDKQDNATSIVVIAVFLTASFFNSL